MTQARTDLLACRQREHAYVAIAQAHKQVLRPERGDGRAGRVRGRRSAAAVVVHIDARRERPHRLDVEHMAREEGEAVGVALRRRHVAPQQQVALAVREARRHELRACVQAGESMCVEISLCCLRRISPPA